MQKLMATLLAVWVFQSPLSVAVSPARLHTASTESLFLPLVFVENRGQWPDEVRYRTEAVGAVIWFTRDGVRYQFTGSDAWIRSAPEGLMPDAEITGINRLPYYRNYFYGTDPARWVTDVPTYEAIQYRNVLPGMDIRYYVRDGHLEYDLELMPGFDPEHIRMAYHGADRIEIGESGELIVAAGGHRLIESAPIIYQHSQHGRRKVAGKLVDRGDGMVGLEVAADYNQSLALVVDPVLKFSTYFGGGQIDVANDITNDAVGNAVVVGYTTSTDFPTVNPYDGTLNRSKDVVVSKVISNGTSLLYSTYIGGLADDAATGVALDAAGNIYVCGTTLSSDFPLQSAFDNTANGEDDLFVLKLSATGDALVYSTYLGGSDIDQAERIVVDAGGYACLTGRTYSTDFPVAFATDATFNGGVDAFISRLSPSGTTLAFSTYLGGTGVDAAKDISRTIDGVVVAGLTTSSAFPTTVGAYDVTYNGQSDMFITRYTWGSTGATITASTFLGGTAGETDRVTVAAGPAGQYRIGGCTASSDFPVVDAYDATYNGGGDAIVALLSSDLSTLEYSTYFGGTGNDVAYNITVDAEFQTYLVGYTGSTDFPLLNAFDSVMALTDAFIARFDIGGVGLSYSTLLGGSGADLAYSIARDNAGAVFVAGQTTSSDFPNRRAFDTSLGGGTDAFICKLGGITTACCYNMRGDVDDDNGDLPNVADLTFLVAYLFTQGTEPPCPEEANVDGDASNEPNVADLTHLVGYLFASGPPPAMCP